MGLEVSSYLRSSRTATWEGVTRMKWEWDASDTSKGRPSDFAGALRESSEFPLMVRRELDLGHLCFRISRLGKDIQLVHFFG